MSWYRESDKSKNPSYSPPSVGEQKLDSGGNYVSATPDGQASSSGAAGHPKPQGESVIK